MVRTLLLWLSIFVVGAPRLSADGGRAGQRGGAPVCPYCNNDPKLLEAAGLVGHVPMPFGKSTSDDVKKFLSYSDPIFLESKHFRIGSTLEAYNVPEKDWKRVAVELAELHKVLPAVPEKTKRIDPWLRIHLYAMRCESLYAKYLDLIKVADEEFSKPRQTGVNYLGEGPYMGMKEKFEVFLHKDLRAHIDMMRDQTGATQKQTKRWHYVERGALTVSIPAIDDLRQDYNLYAHLAHNLGHNFVVGFKHYSYEPPVWIEEGFAHWFEKQVNDDFNSFDSEEAALGDMYAGKDWRAGTLRVIDNNRAAALADLVHKKSLSEIAKEDHLIVWSKVDFLLRNHPEEFAKLLGGLKGRLGKEGLADGSKLVDAQRELLRTIFGWTFADFDREWEKWARKAYAPKAK